MKNTNTNATKSTSTIRLSTAQKSESYNTYLTMANALIAVANYHSDAGTYVDLACNSLAALVKSVHGVEVNAAALWSNALVRLVSFKTQKENKEKGKEARQWVKFNGIATFNKWLKEYAPAKEIEVEYNEGKAPGTKKPKSMPNKKEVAINILKALPEEERMALLEQLLAV